MGYGKYSFLVKNLSINQRGDFFMSALPKELIQEIIRKRQTHQYLKLQLGLPL